MTWQTVNLAALRVELDWSIRPPASGTDSHQRNRLLHLPAESAPEGSQLWPGADVGDGISHLLLRPSPHILGFLREEGLAGISDSFNQLQLGVAAAVAAPSKLWLPPFFPRQPAWEEASSALW